MKIPIQPWSGARNFLPIMFLCNAWPWFLSSEIHAASSVTRGWNSFFLPPPQCTGPSWECLDDAANHSIENPSDSEPLTGRLGYLGWFTVILLTRPINNSTNIFLMLATCLHWGRLLYYAVLISLYIFCIMGQFIIVNKPREKRLW